MSEERKTQEENRPTQVLTPEQARSFGFEVADDVVEIHVYGGIMSKPITRESKAESLFKKLEECAEITWTDTPFMGNRPYATFNREKALTLILEALR